MTDMENIGIGQYGLPKRKQIRLPNYDYSSPGACFITICTKDRQCMLSDIRRGDPCGRPSPILTAFGRIGEQAMKQTEELYAVQIEPYVIMPNHIHFICMIEQARATTRVAPTANYRIATLAETYNKTHGYPVQETVRFHGQRKNLFSLQTMTQKEV